MQPQQPPQQPHIHRQVQISPFLNAILSGAIGVPDAEGLCIQQCKGIAQLTPGASRDRDGGGNSALHFAMKRGWLALAQYLIDEEGISATDEGEGGQQPIHWASAWASVRAIALLANHGASLEARSADGCVPLHFAAMHGQHTAVYYLLAKGCSVDAADSQGYTALHRAACHPHRLVVQTILDFGGLTAAHVNLVNQRDAAGRSALHWAATTPEGSSKHAVVRALLEAGCDVSGPGATDVDGRDVLAHASHHGFERTAKHIQEYVARKRTSSASTTHPNGGGHSSSGDVRSAPGGPGAPPPPPPPPRQRSLRKRLEAFGASLPAPLCWVALALSVIWRNLCTSGRGGGGGGGGGMGKRKDDVGVLCVVWFSCSISTGVWIWWYRFLAQDGTHPHLVLSMLFLLFLCAEVGAYTSMVHSKPGFLPTGSKQIAAAVNLLESDGGAEERWCYTCKIVRPWRSKHCATCDRCVGRFDHHCNVVHNCVGEGNHRLFIVTLMLFDVLVVCWELLFCAFVYNHPAAPWSASSAATLPKASAAAAAAATTWSFSGGLSAFLTFTIVEIPLATLFACYLLGMMGFVSGTCMQQLRNLSTGWTANEVINAGRGKASYAYALPHASKHGGGGRGGGAGGGGNGGNGGNGGGRRGALTREQKLRNLRAFFFDPPAPASDPSLPLVLGPSDCEDLGCSHGGGGG